MTEVFEVDVYEFGDFDFEIGFEDVVAHEYSDLVDACVDALATDLPGVTRAVREDREVILVAGPRLTVEALHEWLSAWWSRHDIALDD